MARFRLCRLFFPFKLVLKKANINTNLKTRKSNANQDTFSCYASLQYRVTYCSLFIIQYCPFQSGIQSISSTFPSSCPPWSLSVHVTFSIKKTSFVTIGNRSFLGIVSWPQFLLITFLIATNNVFTSHLSFCGKNSFEESYKDMGPNIFWGGYPQIFALVLHFKLSQEKLFSDVYSKHENYPQQNVNSCCTCNYFLFLCVGFFLISTLIGDCPCSVDETVWL